MCQFPFKRHQNKTPNLHDWFPTLWVLLHCLGYAPLLSLYPPSLCVGLWRTLSATVAHTNKPFCTMYYIFQSDFKSKLDSSFRNVLLSKTKREEDSLLLWGTRAHLGLVSGFLLQHPVFYFSSSPADHLWASRLTCFINAEIRKTHAQRSI